MLEPANSTPEAFFTWRGQDLRTMGQINDMLAAVTDPAEAQSFTSFASSDIVCS